MSDRDTFVKPHESTHRATQRGGRIISAQAEVRKLFLEAKVARSSFGMIVVTADDGISLGDGRAYYEEQAWLRALEDEKYVAAVARRH